MPTALIVDDDLTTCQMLQACLEHAGYSVVFAQNGGSALDLLTSRSFALITLDLAMPRINGSAVLKAIRADDQHDQAVVVVITGTPHMIDRETADMADFIMNKPLDIMEFSRFAERLNVEP